MKASSRNQLWLQLELDSQSVPMGKFWVTVLLAASSPLITLHATDGALAEGLHMGTTELTKNQVFGEKGGAHIDEKGNVRT